MSHILLTGYGDACHSVAIHRDLHKNTSMYDITLAMASTRYACLITVPNVVSVDLCVLQVDSPLIDH